MFIKDSVKSFARKLGFDIIRYPQLEMWRDSQNWDQIYNLYPSESVRNKRFYNIGAGKFSHFAWTNVEKSSSWYKDHQSNFSIDIDLNQKTPLPIDSNVAEAVYTSHTAEHLVDDVCQHMFNESYRILKPGGYFRVTCPNADLEYRAYMEGDREYFFWRHAYSVQPCFDPNMYKQPFNQLDIEQLLVWHIVTGCSENLKIPSKRKFSSSEIKTLIKELSKEEFLNYLTANADLSLREQYPNFHVSWWSPEKMRRALEQAGFKKIYLSGYGQSFCPAMRDTQLFDNTHPKMSLYVEAQK